MSNVDKKIAELDVVLEAAVGYDTEKADLAADLILALETLGLLDHVGMPEPYATHVARSISKICTKDGEG